MIPKAVLDLQVNKETNGLDFGVCNKPFESIG